LFVLERGELFELAPVLRLYSAHTNIQIIKKRSVHCFLELRIRISVLCIPVPDEMFLIKNDTTGTGTSNKLISCRSLDSTYKSYGPDLSLSSIS
jgi:hypothetical protein